MRHSTPRVGETENKNLMVHHGESVISFILTFYEIFNIVKQKMQLFDFTTYYTYLSALPFFSFFFLNYTALWKFFQQQTLFKNKYSLSINNCCRGNNYLLIKLRTTMVCATSMGLLEIYDVIRLKQWHAMILLVKHWLHFRWNCNTFPYVVNKLMISLQSTVLEIFKKRKHLTLAKKHLSFLLPRIFHNSIKL